MEKRQATEFVSCELRQNAKTSQRNCVSCEARLPCCPLFKACRDPLVGEKVEPKMTCHTPETVPTFEHETDQRSWETQNRDYGRD